MCGNKQFVNLKTKVYNTIRDRILRCELEPKDLIVENDLIKQLGVSRTPIREALHKLENENLINVFPKRGTFVSGISVKDVINIYDLRIILEPYAATLAIDRIDEKNLKKYYQIWVEEVPKISDEEHIRYDRKFHGMIAESSGNSFLSSFLYTLYDNVSRVRYLLIKRKTRTRMTNIRTEHKYIIECLMNKDKKHIANAMEEHLKKAKEVAVEILMDL